MGNPPKGNKTCCTKKSFAGTASSSSLNEAIDSGKRAFFCHYNCNCILVLFWAARPCLLLCTRSNKLSTQNLANKTAGPTQGNSAPATLFFGISVKVAIMTHKHRFCFFFNMGSVLPTEPNQASYA